MKLSSKLSLAFSLVIILLLILAGIAWNSMNDMQRVKNLLAHTEDAVTETSFAQNSAISAIANNDSAFFAKIKEHINNAKNYANLVKSLAGEQTTLDVVANYNNKIDHLLGSVQALEKSYATLEQSNQDATTILATISSGIEKIRAKEEQNVLRGNSRNFIAIQRIDFKLLNLTLHLSNYLRVPNADNLQIVLDGVEDLAFTAQIFMERNEEFNAVCQNILLYIEKVNEIIENNKAMQIALQKDNAELTELIKIALDFSTFARGQYDLAKQKAEVVLLITTVLAVLLGIILTIFISKSVLKQLGADPSVLSTIASKVADGDYDIDDGKTHIGVYNNIVLMVQKMKEVLEYSQNIVATYPVATAIFGADNRLKYANNEMMKLLEIQKPMEECVGETSGQFMYRKEDFNTATLKAINAKQQGRVNIEYTTHRGNKIHVDTIAQPMKNANGEITDVISVWRDVTEQTIQANKIAKANEHMQNVARELEQVASIASSASEQLSAQIELSENGAQDQADRVAVTATALEEMNATVLEIARNAGSTSESAVSVRQEASLGSEAMQECVNAMVHVRTQSLQLQDEMNVLSGHAQAINEIMTVISDIADQTNLLALNAAIEAARAGEAGRGFAVVADEVRNLAEKTMSSTTDVGNAISAIQKSTADNTRLVLSAVDEIEKVTEMVSKAGSALQGIVNIADTTADQVHAIATASEEQSATSEEITQSVESINAIAKENANTMREAKQAVNEVVNQTQVLSSLIVQLQSSE